MKKAKKKKTKKKKEVGQVPWGLVRLPIRRVSNSAKKPPAVWKSAGWPLGWPLWPLTQKKGD